MRAGATRAKELLKRYGSALVIVGIAFGLRLVFAGLSGRHLGNLTFFCAAVMLAAILGGFGPGLLATGIAALFIWYGMSQVPGPGELPTTADAVELALFLGVGIGLSLVAELYHRTRRKVAALELDSAVRENEMRLRQESERALQESEKRLRTLAAATFEGIAVSEEGRYTDLNEQLARMLGYTREEILGMEVAALIAPADRARALENILQGKESRIEHEMLRKDGTRITVEAHGQTVELDGRAVRVTALREITERKHAERALQESEAKYRQLVELLPAAVYACDCDGTVTFYNERAVALWRRRPQPGDRGTQFCGCLQARLTNGTPGSLEDLPLAVACRAGQSARNVEGILEWADGNHVDVLVNIDPIRDREGRTMGAISVLTDVTERKQAQLALQSQNRRLGLLNEAAANLLSAERPEQALAEVFEGIGRFFQVCGVFEFELSESGDELRSAFCVGMGEPQQECRTKHLKLGEGILGLVAQQRQPIVLAHVQESPHPNSLLLKDLGVRSYACFPLVIGPRLLGTLSFASRERDELRPADVEFFQTLASYLALAKERQRLRLELQRHAAELEHTVEERTSKLRELVAELEHMSYSIVHDMRAPLRALQSFAAIISRNESERLTSESRDLLERMVTATNRMDLLITDALSYNKAVRSELPLQPVDVGALLQGMLRSYPEFQPEHAEIRLEGELPPVQGNEAGLTQCFSNLLHNAVKFAKPGTKPRVRVWAEVRPEPKAVRLWFADEGIGIPKESQERLFRMFQRLHGPEYEGTGIGLALVRKVIERMGGRVGVESEVDQGSRFWLELAPAGSQRAQAAADWNRKLAA